MTRLRDAKFEPKSLFVGKYLPDEGMSITLVGSLPRHGSVDPNVVGGLNGGFLVVDGSGLNIGFLSRRQFTMN